MNRLGAILAQPRRSSPKLLFDSPESGCEKSHSIEQRRTSTCSDGLVTFGGWRVYWYASVSTRKPGNSLLISAAASLHRRIHGPASEPSSLTIARHCSHWQAPSVSFWLMEMMPASGCLRTRNSALAISSRRIAALERHSCVLAWRLPWSSANHSGCCAKYCPGVIRSKDVWHQPMSV